MNFDDIEWSQGMVTPAQPPAGLPAAAPAAAPAPMQSPAWNSAMATPPAGLPAGPAAPAMPQLQPSPGGPPPAPVFPGSPGSDESSSDDDTAGMSSSDDEYPDWDPQGVVDDLASIIRRIAASRMADGRIVSLDPLYGQGTADDDALATVLEIIATELTKNENVRVMYRSNANPIAYQQFLTMSRAPPRDVAKALLKSQLIYATHQHTPLLGQTPRTKRMREDPEFSTARPFVDLAV
jgi:hypothetical protein